MKFRTPILLLLVAIFGWSALARGQVSISLDPKSGILDFGRVRLGRQADSMFAVVNSDTTGVTVVLDNVIYQTFINDQDFQIDTLNKLSTVYTLPPFAAVRDSVHFKPKKLGRFVETIPIHTLDGKIPISLELAGEGVKPQLVSSGYDFGALRVGAARAVSIAISNRGTDSTLLDSVTIVDGSDTTSFKIDSVSRARRSIILGYRSGTKIRPQGTDTTTLVTVQFAPQKLGRDTMVLRIHSSDSVFFVKVFGIGAAPLVRMVPDTIKFGTVTVTNTVPPWPHSSFTISNAGSYVGHLDSLRHTDNAHFLLSTVGVLNQSLAIDSQLVINTTFIDTEEGDFIDTVYLYSDTAYRLFGDSIAKYRPILIQTASVRTAPLIIAPKFFDTVRTCDTIRHDIVIHNPFPISISIDTITFDSTAAGLTSDPNHPHGSKIIIPADSEYTLHLAYNFPPDSLNGLQQMTMYLIERHGDAAPTIGTATALVYRLRQELTLHALLPTFVSSANDVAPLRLPIKIEGPRAGVHELDAWTLALTFSNDLFEPTGLDTSGGLVTAHDTTPFSLSTSWDQPTRTYKITVSGAKLSDSNSIYNLLLFNVKMRAYLTMDTSVTVTPTFTFVTHPCAYSLLPFTLTIPYANDCGDVTIRSFLLGDAEPFRITGLWPDPAGADGVSISYDAAQAMQLSATVSDAAGKLIGTHVWTTDVGSGMQKLPADLLPHSGAAYLTVEAHSTTGALLGRRSLKLSVDR